MVHAILQANPASAENAKGGSSIKRYMQMSEISKLKAGEPLLLM
jgi:hypothetical protein